MTGGENTQQTYDPQHGNGQAAESELHWVHLLTAEGELPAESRRCRTYLSLCGELLGTAELAAAECDAAECEREIVYCLECIRVATGCNSDAGVGVGCSPYVRTDR